jgi:hypothetical protein
VSAADIDRKQRGAWFTPFHLVDEIIAAVIDEKFVRARRGRRIRVIDPACGDGRFLTAAVDAIRAHGGDPEAIGVDIDEPTLADNRPADVELVHDDALRSARLTDAAGSFDLVIGNPPFLSQMAAATTRGGASTRGGGPYADAAVEFLALAADLVDPVGGRVAFVLPQSVLAARDAGAVRRRFDEHAAMFWSAWTGDRDFEAQVLTCAVAFEFGGGTTAPTSSWAHVVTERAGVPPIPSVDWEREVLGDRARLNANFRDEYYGMVPSVGDHDEGPPLITSGLIDPGCSLWSEVPVRFAKQRFAAPRIDLATLDDKMSAWAAKRLVPKVLVANQTPIVEAVADAGGCWLPGVPVVAVYPNDAAAVWEIAAVLTSPTASVWAWHQRGGTGLSPNTIRVGPTMLAELPWPTGDLGPAVQSLRAGDVRACGRLVDAAYGIDHDSGMAAYAWWCTILDRIEARRA